MTTFDDDLANRIATTFTPEQLAELVFRVKGGHFDYLVTGPKRSTVLDQLSTRERQVLDMLALGYRASVIAKENSTALTTVRSQIRSLLIKLDVNSQLEAVAILRSETMMRTS